VARRRLTPEILGEEMTSHPRWGDFIAFHDRNPQVFEWLLEEAHKAVAKGYRLSARYLFERLRAEGPVEIKGAPVNGYVLSNDFVALYARGLMYEDPSLKRYLEIRSVKRVNDEQS
jgi:hypothetical protein